MFENELNEFNNKYEMNGAATEAIFEGILCVKSRFIFIWLHTSPIAASTLLKRSKLRIKRDSF